MGKNADMEQHRLAMRADIEQLGLAMKADLDRQTAMLKNWALKLLLAQTALILAVAAGAVVVAGLLWG